MHPRIKINNSEVDRILNEIRKHENAIFDCYEKLSKIGYVEFVDEEEKPDNESSFW